MRDLVGKLSLFCNKSSDLKKQNLLGIVTYRGFVSESIWTNEESFERAPKTKSNYWRKKFVRQPGTELQT